MNIVSLFDGMSCLQIALKELGIPVSKYYFSEIDSHAIKQTELNFPDAIPVGNVENWRLWDIDWGKVDLIGAGSPCQGFSFAGKQLAFDDPRSKLFFVFADILAHCKSLNPNVKFLLENVNMKKAHMRVISEFVGVFPVNINSNLVSAQNRDRWYWTNIITENQGLFGDLYSGVPQPTDRGILLKDILENEVAEKYYISQAVIDRMNRKEYSKPKINPDKTGSINTNNNSPQMSLDSGTTFISVVNYNGTFRETEKVNCIDANYHKGLDNHAQRSMVCVRFGRTEEAKQIRKTSMKNGVDYTPFQAKEIVGFSSDKMNTATCATTKYNWIMQINTSKESGGKQPFQGNRVYDENGIMPAVMTENRGSVLTQSKIRRLTPIEVSRLQTIPDWYIWKCSDTQIYRMCGNGWTVDVIVWILSFLPSVFQLKNIAQQKPQINDRKTN